MQVPIDSNPSARVIQFKAVSDKAIVEIKARDYKSECEHGNFLVDEKNRTVECGKCKRQIDAMHTLVLIANSERMRRYAVECREEFTRKEVGKTIKAAVIALIRRGVTPESFRSLCEKYAAEAAEAK